LNGVPRASPTLLNFVASGCFDSYKIDYSTSELRYYGGMAVIHISEAEAARDLSGIMARVYAGEEVIISNGTLTVAVVPLPFRYVVQSQTVLRLRECTKSNPAKDRCSIPTLQPMWKRLFVTASLGIRQRVIDSRFQLLDGG
jgi:antitoxin (DNA-binding transcriptional repressor) of toxin-antitoxin stability system